MINYPNQIDTEEVLPTVHDSLRLRLSEDYEPGDNSVVVEGDIAVFAKFPNIGYLTLTEQCSEPELRAISFHYASKAEISESLFTFNGLELLTGFQDASKPKKLTNVTQNVIAEYHNALKDAIIAIEEFVGVKGTLDLMPYGETMEGRINFLHKLVLKPKAWFTANRTYGLVPLEVTFTNKSFQIGENCPVGDVQIIWDFGDGDCSQIACSTIEVTDVVPIEEINVRVLDTDGDTVVKTYTIPGKYDVSLTVINKWGEDTVIFPGFVIAKLPAPEEATIDIVPRDNQILIAGYPLNGPPFTIFPTIRSPIDTFIDFEIQSGTKSGTESIYAPYGRSYGGEILSSSRQPIDSIVDYNWQLSDDLSHGNSQSAKASYSIGGVYDLVLRVDTEFDSYKITNYIGSIDIVEKTNMWLWNFKSGSNEVEVSEYGLISETFKTRPTALYVTRNPDFLEGEINKDQLIREFNRNTFTSPRSTTQSGEWGEMLIYWASGRNYGDPISEEKINIVSFNGFSDTYTVPASPTLTRPWNWLGFSIYPYSFFILGNSDSIASPNTSPTNMKKLTQDLSDPGLIITEPSFSSIDFTNGAVDLMENVCIFDSMGQPYQGHFSAYRGTSRNNTGYFIRNDGVGVFYRLKSFYKTEGILSNPIQKIKKLPDMQGSLKMEGQFLSLTSGLFFFDNSASISAYNESGEVWETGSANASSASFTSLQDRTQIGFSKIENTLLGVSDGDRKAYLSYDYSPNAFIQFNEANLSFKSLGNRPSGDQWLMSVY
jgi:PKD repeat protein